MASFSPVRALRAALAAAALAFAAAAAAEAPPPQGTVLTPEEMRATAAASLGAGRPRQALDLAGALLARDPGDAAALAVRARALRDLGRHAEGAAAGRAAWRAAETDAERYGAALVTAQALSSAGARTRAQLWLRRAVEVAPSEATRAKAIRDFRYVRARNPWAVDLSFNIAPSDNVNDGSVHDTISFAGLDGVVLDGAAQALSGLEISGGVAVRRRLSESRRHKTEAGLSLYHETYLLSDAAREQAPDVAGSDFAYSSAALSLSHETRPAGWSGPLALSLAVGRSRYGGDPYARFLRAGMARTFGPGARTRLRLSLAAERFVLLPEEDARDRADSLSAGAEMLHGLEGGGVLRLALGVKDSRSERTTLDYRRATAGLGYTLAEPIAGARATAGLEMRWRDYPAWPFETDGRQDRGAEARLDFVFTGLDSYGFVPTMSLFRATNRSNVERQETVETGVSFGVRSAF